MLAEVQKTKMCLHYYRPVCELVYKLEARVELMVELMVYKIA